MMVCIDPPFVSLKASFQNNICRHLAFLMYKECVEINFLFLEISAFDGEEETFNDVLVPNRSKQQEIF